MRAFGLWKKAKASLKHYTERLLFEPAECFVTVITTTSHFIK